jgi:hypothetical protein
MSGICGIEGPPCYAVESDKQVSLHYFNSHKEDVATYRTLAVAMLQAGLAVAGAALDASSINQDSCLASVRSWFGADADLKELCKRLSLVLQQLRCNAVEVLWMDEYKGGHPIKDTWIAFAVPFEGVHSKGKFWAGAQWSKCTDMDRGATYLHEATHFVIKTVDITYNLAECRQLAWKDASRNARTYEAYCVMAYRQMLAGDMMNIVPDVHSEIYNIEPYLGSVFSHVPALNPVKYACMIVGDKYGEKVAGGPLFQYHVIGQYWTIVPLSGSSFSVSCVGAGIKTGHPMSLTSCTSTRNGNVGGAYHVIDDGVNTFYVKMLSSRIGFGVCLCGGSGGRSFQIIQANASIFDGRV